MRDPSAPGALPPSLASLLASPPAPGRVVALDGERRYDAADFAGRVAGLAGRLPKGREAGRVLLDVGDAVGFAVALFAGAVAGVRLVVPPSRAPEVLAEWGQGCDAWLSDLPSATRPADAIDPLAVTPAPFEPVSIDETAPLLELGTSGSTGASKRVPKSLAQLDEVRVLEGIAGAALPTDAVVFATAPPQHLYGLLFRVLWPLVTGRPFAARSWLRPEELLPRLEAFPATALVATPVHLRRLAGRPELRALRSTLALVVSSGGPLDADTAASLASDLGAAPLEVFGSTETGGVATRRQDARGSETPWSPLPGVTWQASSEAAPLVVRSPFVSVGAPDDDGTLAFRMGDRAEALPDGRFRLLGRADRTVKIGEKRLHLPDMESRLCEHAWVSEAALVTIVQAGERRSAAVVVPSAEGAAVLADEGRRRVVRELGDALAPAFDRVLLPRAMRFVPDLPRDSRGKTPLAVLEALFEQGDGAPRDPVRLDREESAERIRDEIAVPVDLAAFDGHFPGHPVVPGVVRLQWVLDAAAALLGTEPIVHRIDALKFPSVLGPRDRTTLEVAREGERLVFSLHAGDTIHASGRLVVEGSARS